MNFQKLFDYSDRPASGRTTELKHAADRLSGFHRISWKQALGKIASAMPITGCCKTPGASWTAASQGTATHE